MPTTLWAALKVCFQGRPLLILTQKRKMGSSDWRRTAAVTLTMKQKDELLQTDKVSCFALATKNLCCS